MISKAWRGGVGHSYRQILLHHPPLIYRFAGSIEAFYVNRVFWALEARTAQLPITFAITDPHADDGLDRDGSLRLSADRLLATQVALNFTTRGDGSNIVIPGRSIDAISLGRLLLQESCPAFHSYFVCGEHFLEFYDIVSLTATVERLYSQSTSARLIAANGYRFYLDRYSRKKMVQHFQWLLDS